MYTYSLSSCCSRHSSLRQNFRNPESRDDQRSTQGKFSCEWIPRIFRQADNPYHWKYVTTAGFVETYLSAHEEDLKDRLDAAIEAYPDTVAVLVRRHGIYGAGHRRFLLTVVWGNTWEQCKCITECIDYLCSLAVEMKKLGIPCWFLSEFYEWME
jgi:hypothetical protein